MELNESKIAGDCAKGDWDEFGKLYDWYLPKIYQYLYYRIRHQQTAEDLTGAVFLKVVQHMGEFRATHATSFAAWIYRIARNTLIDHTRRPPATLDLDTALDVAAADDVAARTDRSLKLGLIQKGLGTLTDQQREIVTLRVWDNLSHAEIAAILNISEANSKITFSRAVATLKQTVPLAVFLAIFSNPLI